MKKFVWWDDFEKVALAEAVSRYLLNHPGTTLLGALNAVQERTDVIKPDRKRQVKALSQVPWLEEDVKKLIEAVKDRERRYKDAEQSAAAARDALEKAAVRAPNTAQVLSDASVVDIFAAMYNRIETKLSAAVENTRQTQLYVLKALSILGSNQSETIASTVHKNPRVCIIGANPSYRQNIHTAYDAKFRLRFIEVNQNSSELPDADYYILLTDHTSHKWSNVLPRDQRLHRITGALSTVLSKLEDLSHL